MRKIIHHNKIPFYRQVAVSLSNRIKTGKYPEGSNLPSVRNLCEEFNVSINVIQRALKHLSQEGLIAIQQGKGCKIINYNQSRKSAVLFGFIHPYSSDMFFEQQMLHFAQEAFEKHNNMVVIRSSNSNTARERSLAENFVDNNFQGLILLPADDNPNGHFFEKLSKKIPVITIDRQLTETVIPTVSFDCRKIGSLAVDSAFSSGEKTKLLVLMDNLNIPTYADIIDSINCRSQEHKNRITIISQPITKAIRKMNKGDYRQIDSICRLVQKMINAEKYDTIFCPHDDFIDFGLLQTQLIKDIQNIHLITTTTAPTGSSRSRVFNNTPITKIRLDYIELITKAAESLQDKVFSNQSSIKTKIIEPKIE